MSTEEGGGERDRGGSSKREVRERQRGKDE